MSTSAWVPVDETALRNSATATASGWTPVQEGAPKPLENPGFFKSAGGELMNMVKGIPAMFHGDPDLPGGGPMGSGVRMLTKMVTEDAARKADFRSPAYRAVAALGTPLGINASGMEQAASQGNTSGVAGIAAGDLIPWLAGSAAGPVLDAAKGAPMAVARAVSAPVVRAAVKAVSQSADVAIGAHLGGVPGAFAGRMLQPFARTAEAISGPVSRWADAKVNPSAPGLVGNDFVPASTASTAPGGTPPEIVSPAEAVSAARAPGWQTAGVEPSHGPSGVPVTEVGPRPGTPARFMLPASTPPAESPTMVGSPATVSADNSTFSRAKAAWMKANPGKDPTTSIQSLSEIAQKANEMTTAPKTPSAAANVTPQEVMQQRFEAMKQEAPAAAAETSAIPQRPTSRAEIMDDKAVQQAMQMDLDRHGWRALSEEKQAFYANNAPQLTKLQLIANSKAQQVMEAAQTQAQQILDEAHRAATTSKAVKSLTTAGAGATVDMSDILQQSIDMINAAKAARKVKR